MYAIAFLHAGLNLEGFRKAVQKHRPGDLLAYEDVGTHTH
jgi:hypothetical protein